MADDWGNDPVQSLGMDETDAHALFDKVFGKGKWKLTGGYRTPAREDELRREGAETVPAGHLSTHSEGTPDAPGAYDIVVDGMSPTMAADKLNQSGSKFAKLFPEGASGTQGGHLHVQPIPEFHDDWGNDPVVTPKPEPPAPPKPTPRQKASLIDQAGGAAARTAGHFASDIADRSHAAQAQTAADYGPASADPRTAVTQAVRRAGGPVTAAEDALSLGGAPIQGAIDTIIGRPVEAITGGRISREQAGDWASVALPFVGEGMESAAIAREAARLGVSPEVLQANQAARAAAGKTNSLKAVTQTAKPQSEHQAAVARLRADGVEIPAHQAAGGVTGRVTEGLKSDFHFGGGIRGAEEAGQNSFNRAFYNKILKPIGDHFGRDAPVGNKGVAEVGNRVSAAYDEILPQIKVKVGRPDAEELQAIERKAAKLGPDDQARLKAILDQEVRTHFGTGDTIDGKTFKSMQSQLSAEARTLRRQQNYPMVDLVDDVSALIREKAERDSGSEAAKRLKSVNQSWAMLTRLEDAASRRLQSNGVITPTDLLAAIRKGDLSARHRSFSRGDAMFQQFAQDADLVLSPKVRDSGTPERSMAIAAAHGIGGAALGHATGLGDVAGGLVDFATAPATNALARHLLTGRRTAAPANYLKAIQQRQRGAYLPAATAISDQSQ